MFRVSVVKDVLQMRLAVTGVVNTFIWLMCSVLQTESGKKKTSDWLMDFSLPLLSHLMPL